MVSRAFGWMTRLGLWHKSTQRLFEESRTLLDALHGYVYARFPKPYVRLLLTQKNKVTHDGVENLAARYHGKVLTHDHARAIVQLNRDIPLRDLEQIVPYSVARDLVLHGPPDVAAYECPCRHARASHCEPTQVCMVIGQPMVDFVLAHNPKDSRRLTQEEALELLREEHQRGHLHSAWFKDAMMHRFYCICNCCQCCCGGIETMKKHGVAILASSGYVAELDDESCSRCGNCVAACPFDALFLRGDRVALDWVRCLGCGLCGVNCPTEAIYLVRDERKGAPLDVRRFSTP
jgi:Pyruvate/2-oxoacid:ferredoxin oxidoreductase delta subunit